MNERLRQPHFIGPAKPLCVHFRLAASSIVRQHQCTHSQIISSRTQPKTTMAPKKKEEMKEKPILGRFRSNLKVMRCGWGPAVAAVGQEVTVGCARASRCIDAQQHLQQYPLRALVLGKPHAVAGRACADAQMNTQHVTAALGLLSVCGLSAQMGIVGLPNVGKSTLFNTLTKLSIPAENFPFCTIEPNQVCLCQECTVRSGREDRGRSCEEGSGRGSSNLSPRRVADCTACHVLPPLFLNAGSRACAR